MRNRKNTLIVVFALFFMAYLASYVVLSRRGYSEADQFRMKGFYYVFPENTDTWYYKNYGCRILFWPVNLVDRSIGLGRYPASSAPLFELGKG